MTPQRSSPTPPSSLSWKGRVRREVANARRIAILGVGHRDQGDDAAGSFCAEALRTVSRGRFRSRLKILAGREAPESLTGKIRKFGPDLVMILDAAAGHRRPGAVFLVDADDIADEGLTTHNLSLKYLVAYLEETLPCRVLILGIQPKTIAWGAPLSTPVENGIKSLVFFLEKALSLGIGTAAGARRGRSTA
jgi:hydrogenase 3 maturation protease